MKAEEGGEGGQRELGRMNRREIVGGAYREDSEELAPEQVARIPGGILIRRRKTVKAARVTRHPPLRSSLFFTFWLILTKENTQTNQTPKSARRRYVVTDMYT